MQVNAPRIRWRVCGLLLGSLSFTILTPFPLISKVVTGFVFAFLLIIGSRYRTLFWLTGAIKSIPPFGGRWSGALLTTGLYGIIMSEVTGQNHIPAITVGLCVALGFAKISCFYNGCCAWTAPFILWHAGQKAESLLAFLIAISIVAMGFRFGFDTPSISLIGVSSLFVLRSFSRFALGHSLFEPGGFILLTIIGWVLLQTN